MCPEYRVTYVLRGVAPPRLYGLGRDTLRQRFRLPLGRITLGVRRNTIVALTYVSAGVALRTRVGVHREVEAARVAPPPLPPADAARNRRLRAVAVRAPRTGLAGRIALGGVPPLLVNLRHLRLSLPEADTADAARRRNSFRYRTIASR